MGFESLPGSFLPAFDGGTGLAASLQRVTAGFAGYLARRFALLLFTLVLVPSLSFCFFQLLEQDIPGPRRCCSELVDYLGATFLHADLGSGNFQNQTFIRTRSAFSVISDGFVVDVALLGGALVAGVLIGLAAGAVQAVWPALGRVARDRRRDGVHALLARLLARACWCCSSSRRASARPRRSRSSPPWAATGRPATIPSPSCSRSGSRA